LKKKSKGNVIIERYQQKEQLINVTAGRESKATDQDLRVTKVRKSQAIHPVNGNSSSSSKPPPVKSPKKSPLKVYADVIINEPPAREKRQRKKVERFGFDTPSTVSSKQNRSSSLNIPKGRGMKLGNIRCFSKVFEDFFTK